MASDKEKKEKLLEFLDKKAFDPVLKASDNKYKTEAQKNKLKDVQESTQSEKERFARYKSAKEVKDNYLSDLNSSAAQKIDKELKELNLPRLPEFKDEFLKMCEKLEVT
jgi:histidyl-tRNA synthetase